jgi:hypothetical protein
MKKLLLLTFAALSVLFLGACSDKDDCDSAETGDADCVSDDDDSGSDDDDSADDDDDSAGE